MIRAFSREPGRRVSKQVRVSMNRDNCLAVKYRLRQALRAIVMGLQYIVLGLVNKRRGLPEKDQDSEQPGKEAFVVRVHNRNDYRT